MNLREDRKGSTFAASGQLSRSMLRALGLILATVIGVYLCYSMALPFLPAITGALALAVIFMPFQRWLESILSYPTLAAMICVLLIGLIVIIPTMLVGQRLLMQAANSAELIRSNVESGVWQRNIEAQPRLAPFAAKVEQLIDVPSTVKTLTSKVAAMAGKVLKGSAIQLMSFFLIFYLLFFFLRDRQWILDEIRSLSPMTLPEINVMFERIGDTVHATIYGTLAVACVQGLLGGLMFWWLDISAPFMWGTVMAVLSIVPVLGAFIIWIPAALLLALEGSLGSALILTLWGILVVGTSDNLLRPILLGKRLKMHTVLVFISVVGGLIVFGAAGLILGPVMLTATSVLLDVWTSRAKTGAAAVAEPDTSR